MVLFILTYWDGHLADVVGFDKLDICRWAGSFGPSRTLLLGLILRWHSLAHRQILIPLASTARSVLRLATGGNSLSVLLTTTVDGLLLLGHVLGVWRGDAHGIR